MQQEVREHVENRQEDLDGMKRNIHRFENVLLLEMGDCKKSADGLDKRLSKLEDVSGRLDGVFDSILQMEEGSVAAEQLVQSAFMLLLSSLSSLSNTDAGVNSLNRISLLKQQNIWIWRFPDLF